MNETPDIHDDFSALSKKFADYFGAAPLFAVRSPGRVNLIGEHTDYNGGPVLPFAINLATFFSVGENNERCLKIFSEATGESLSYGLEKTPHETATTLSKILKGSLTLTGYIGPGLNIYADSNLPIGAGLSSSASFIVGMIRCLLTAQKKELSHDELAVMAQKIEHEFLGVHCGIMDQVAICSGKKGAAILLETGKMEKTFLEVPGNIEFAVIDSLSRRSLATSDYNQRGKECLEACKYLGVEHLASLTMDELNSATLKIAPDTLWLKRARHVVSECERVYQVAEHLKAGDFIALGKAISASHQSLRNLFSVSTPLINTLVASAESYPDCYGARIMGAGFGGCILAVLAKGAAAEFQEYFHQRLEQLNMSPLPFYVVKPSAGVSVWRFK